MSLSFCPARSPRSFLNKTSIFFLFFFFPQNRTDLLLTIPQELLWLGCHTCPPLGSEGDEDSSKSFPTEVTPLFAESGPGPLCCWASRISLWTPLNAPRKPRANNQLHSIPSHIIIQSARGINIQRWGGRRAGVLVRGSSTQRGGREVWRTGLRNIPSPAVRNLRLFQLGVDNRGFFEPQHELWYQLVETVPQPTANAQPWHSLMPSAPLAHSKMGSFAPSAIRP